ncbi:uncharacterized protein LOC135643858 isoform X1 [Musa acuminata AAA Group]|uniref:uncharacterized protein LOC135643858 isoform X1 n=1 Tax=Musa acuminata AAA Group TaxID=214697 RepID=UPI0031E3C378
MDAVDSGEAFDLEAKRRDDDSWHPCRITLSSNSAVFRISLNFESCDEEDIISSREDLMGRLRFRSNPVQDNCSHLRGGEKVLVMNIVQSKCFYFDAVIEKAYRVRHSHRLHCRCTFVVKWLVPKLKGITINVPSKSIMKLSDKKIDSHPVVAAFLAALKPIPDVKVLPFLNSLEEATCEANLPQDLEKQVEMISKLADGSEPSKDVLSKCKQANSVRRRRSTITSDTVSLINQGNSRRITRSQTKVNAELVKHCDNAPLLNPLAAQAALASLVHGQLADKQESSIFRLQDCLSDLPLNVEKKQDDHLYLEVEATAIQSIACTMDDVIELPNIVQEVTKQRLIKDLKLNSSIAISRGDVVKFFPDESPYSVTLNKKSGRESNESEIGCLVSSATKDHPTKLTIKGKLNGGGVSTRLTRSGVKRRIFESTEKESSNEKFPSLVSTKLSCSGPQILTKIINQYQGSGERNEIIEIVDLDASEDDESSKRELVFTSMETIIDRTQERKKRPRRSSVKFIEVDQAVVFIGGEISQPKKKRESSKKPIPRFSRRLRLLPGSRSQS